MKAAELAHREELRKYINANYVLVPKAILDEIRLELNLDLLTIAEDAINYLRANIVVDAKSIEDWELVDAFAAGHIDVEYIHGYPEYCVYKAAMEYGLLRAFDNSSFDLRHPARISKAKVCAKAALVEAKKEYDLYYGGKFSSDRLHLFGDDDKNTRGRGIPPL